MENPEKYISIEYEKWNSYYKPLEENYNKLQKKLEEEKESKEIKVYINVYHNYLGTAKLLIGVIDPILHYTFKTSKNIKETIKNVIASTTIYDTLIKKEQLDNIIKEIEQKEENIIKLCQENNKRVSKIPKIIRKIFKIK